MVHDLDIADARFERPETPGVSALIAGICAGTDDDEERIARGSTALDGFYAHFTRRKADKSWRPAHAPKSQSTRSTSTASALARRCASGSGSRCSAAADRRARER